MHQQQQTLPEKIDETGLPNGRYVWSDEQNFQVYGDFMAMFNKTFGDFSHQCRIRNQH